MQPYWQAGTCLVFAVVVLTVAVNLKLPKGKVWVNWILGLVGLSLALAGGFYARRTFVDGLTEGLATWSPWVRLILGLLLIAALSIVVFIAVPDEYSPTSASVAFVFLLFLTPSALGNGLIPDGDIRDALRAATAGAAAPVLELTSGWYR